MVTFGAFGLIFLLLGISLYLMSNKIINVNKQYDSECLK
jgi:hypothetical protein